MDLASKKARLQEQIEQLPGYGDGTLTQWHTKSATLLRMFLGEENALYVHFNGLRYSPSVAPVGEEFHVRSFNSGVGQGVALLEAAITELEVAADMNSGTALIPEPGNEIFVVHGHNEALRLKVVDFLTRATGTTPTVLIDEANRGMELFQKFEEAAERACFAVVLATADDVGRAKAAPDDRPRARQNVILEWGFFAGRLGRDRVTLLNEEGVELPSDIGGLVYTPIDAGGAWKLLLARELRAAGIEASVDRAL
ncbi:nucleotide-binding protein [Mycobacterium hackensackense]|uniref:nucleotide-binding protein n=1 Tax=Mycobacterium hackensackense TaxID=228909 RepID=UPI002265C092|nr:nucleotide-binding protein [Mycobacterium hackensackense]MCV7250813.1 nucleotide-binding protein [Mycobacterium hackensackense]